MLCATQMMYVLHYKLYKNLSKMRWFLFLLSVANAATVRKMVPNAPLYELIASDVVCSGPMIKMYDANDGSYNPGLSTATEVNECIEACRTRLQPSSTSLYQWGDTIPTGSWLKRTVGSDEDGECHCTLEETVCEPYDGGAFPFYDQYAFIKTDLICESSSNKEIEGNYVRQDCSCEFGFAGDLCLDPRMMCILEGTENPDGGSCQCLDSRMNNTGGCCPVGTVYVSNKYASYSPFQSMNPIQDQPYFKDAFLEVCAPHTGLTQNDTAPEADRSRSVINYVTDAQEMRVIGPSTACTRRTAKVDFLYDYEYMMRGYCKPDDFVRMYDTSWMDNDKD